VNYGEDSLYVIVLKFLKQSNFTEIPGNMFAGPSGRCRLCVVPVPRVM